MVLCLVVLGISTFVQKNNSLSNKSVIKIGVITPLTGEAAAWGTWVKKGLDLAVAEIGNSKIKLIYEDDKCDPKTGVDAYNKLINIDHVDMITGLVCSSVALAVEPLANKDGIPMITTGASATTLRGKGDQVFNAWSLNDVQAIFVADYLIDSGVKKVAILSSNNDLGVTLKDGFKAEFEKKGGIITTMEVVDQKSTDVKTQLAKIKASNPEYVFLGTYYDNAAYTFKQNKELGYGLKFIGTLDSYNEKVREIAGDAVIGYKYSFAKIDASSTALINFENAYKAKYGEEMSSPGDVAYDAMNLINDAINSGKSVGSYLLSVKDYIGASGKFSFDQNGDAVRDNEIYTITK